MLQDRVTERAERYEVTGSTFYHGEPVGKKGLKEFKLYIYKSW